MSIINSTFTNNRATGIGGGIFNEGDLIVSGNVMIGNVAGLGHMIYKNGTMGVLNLIFIDNSTKIVKIGQNIILYANLTADMGNTITGQNISFYVNGTFIGNIISIKGYANLTYMPNFSYGVVPVTGSYAGSGTHLIVISNGKLNILAINTKITVKIPKNLKVGDSVTIESLLLMKMLI